MDKWNLKIICSPSKAKSWEIPKKLVTFSTPEGGWRTIRKTVLQEKNDFEWKIVTIRLPNWNVLMLHSRPHSLKWSKYFSLILFYINQLDKVNNVLFFQRDCESSICYFPWHGSKVSLSVLLFVFSVWILNFKNKNPPPEIDCINVENIICILLWMLSRLVTRKDRMMRKPNLSGWGSTMTRTNLTRSMKLWRPVCTPQMDPRLWSSSRCWNIWWTLRSASQSPSLLRMIPTRSNITET